MTDEGMLELIAARRAELDLAEEDLVKQLADVRVERDELVVAERVVQRISDIGFGEYLSLAPPPVPEAQVGGRSVLLVPVRAAGVGEDVLPEDYNLIWISSARRGAASEIKTARRDHVVDHLKAAGLGALADLGFVGLDPDRDDPVVITGVKRTRKKKLTAGQKTANQVIAAARAPVEHGFAALKNWRILTRLRLNPARATNLLRALLVLTNLETSR